MTEPLDALNADRLWDAKDVARFFGASRSWVYHRAESGELPCLRVGGLLRFDPEAIRKYAREGDGEKARPPGLRGTRRALRHTA